MFNENDIPVFRAIARAAGELLSDPAKRCRGEPARDKNGKPVMVRSEDACSWCLMGALAYSANKLGHHSSQFDVCDYVKQELCQPGLVEAWEAPGADQNAVVQKLLNL